MGYKGQKELLKNVIDERCLGKTLFGRPRKVTTADKYQGQQNDYILLSLVKTRNVGHIRDVRRLIVATSRARLGLYIFGRVSLFNNCRELRPTVQELLARPTTLILQPKETWGQSKRRQRESMSEHIIVFDLKSMAHFVVSKAHRRTSFE